MPQGHDCLCIHCPDRLAHNYAHQVLLLEEFVRAGVEVNFLNREVGQTPEDQLLLQVQRTGHLKEQIRQIQDEESLQRELHVIIGRLETFAAKGKQGLSEADWLTHREIICTIVKRVEIDQEQVHVIFRIGPSTPSGPSDTWRAISPHTVRGRLRGFPR